MHYSQVLYYVKKVAVLSIGLCTPLLATQTYYLSRIFTNQKLRQQFSGFFDVVLRQVPSKTFYEHLENLDPNADDAVLYAHLLNKRQSFISFFSPVHQLRSLELQKAELGRQAKTLLTSDITAKRVFSGCLEIGNPGTYTSVIKTFAIIRGPMYAVNESEQISDRLQYGGIKPYTMFIPLNDYAPIGSEAVADASIDLVICYRGLHHIPIEKLDSFVASISRALRPGGILLLRDHDSKNEDIAAIVNAAHSVYNIIVSGESLEDEQREYRNFQPLDYWIKLLSKHGLTVGNDRILQQEDPTLNTMIKFTKTVSTDQDNIASISSALKTSPGYHQDCTQTYLTAPEWYNVDVAQEYSSYINHTPFYQFPYMAHVATYWRIFAQSWKAAADKKGHWHVLTSPYTFMNLFVGSTMTIEHTLKAMIAAPLRWAYSEGPVEPLQALIEDPAQEITHLDQRIKVLTTYPKSNLKLVAFPRYKEFSHIVCKLPTTSIIIHEIAGNKQIQIKIRYRRTQSVNIDITGCSKIADWAVPTQPDYHYCGLIINVTELSNVLAYLQKQNIELLYIHDF